MLSFLQVDQNKIHGTSFPMSYALAPCDVVERETETGHGWAAWWGGDLNPVCSLDTLATISDGLSSAIGVAVLQNFIYGEKYFMGFWRMLYPGCGQEYTGIVSVLTKRIMENISAELSANYV